MACSWARVTSTVRRGTARGDLLSQGRRFLYEVRQRVGALAPLGRWIVRDRGHFRDRPLCHMCRGLRGPHEARSSGSGGHLVRRSRVLTKAVIHYLGDGLLAGSTTGGLRSRSHVDRRGDRAELTPDGALGAAVGASEAMIPITAPRSASDCSTRESMRRVSDGRSSRSRSSRSFGRSSGSPSGGVLLDTSAAPGLFLEPEG